MSLETLTVEDAFSTMKKAEKAVQSLVMAVGEVPYVWDQDPFPTQYISGIPETSSDDPAIAGTVYQRIPQNLNFHHDVCSSKLGLITHILIQLNKLTNCTDVTWNLQ